jgi:hypothetical protein
MVRDTDLGSEWDSLTEAKLVTTVGTCETNSVPAGQRAVPGGRTRRGVRYLADQWEGITLTFTAGNYPLWPAVGTTLDGGVQLVITGLAPWLAACEHEKAHQG